MGLLDDLFGRSGKTDSTAGSDASEDAPACVTCGDDLDADERDEDECEDCRQTEYSGAKYCCGMIYEEGEDTCTSCGEAI